jgi:hypothetical protein
MPILLLPVVVGVVVFNAAVPIAILSDPPINV